MEIHRREQKILSTHKGASGTRQGTRQEAVLRDGALGAVIYGPSSPDVRHFDTSIPSYHCSGILKFSLRTGVRVDGQHIGLISGKKNGKWMGSTIDDIKAADRRWQSIAGGIHEGLGPQRTKLSLGISL